MSAKPSMPKSLKLNRSPEPHEKTDKIAGAAQSGKQNEAAIADEGVREKKAVPARQKTKSKDQAAKGKSDPPKVPVKAVKPKSLEATAAKKAAATKRKDGTKTAQKRKAKKAKMPPGFIRQYELVDRVRDYAPDFDEDMLNRAYVYSMQAHGEQTRKSGDPYFTHPLAVAGILTELKADPATVVTALLHDTVEDTETTLEDIEQIFGGEIATLVDGVTKLSKIELRSDATKQAENFRKLVMAMANDIRVLLVKLADRLHNMRTIHHFNRPEKQERIARETLEIYAPLAGRIGIHRFRDELEDLSFREINREAFHTIEERLGVLQASTVTGVVELAQTLRERLTLAGIHAEVISREKRPYSIWRKMEAKNISFEELADIYAFRVIVDNVEQCYRALGLIHTRWRMIPEEFDDYISIPKPNNYQSIHTAVIGPPTEGGSRQRIEIQIRTHKMHDHAERGAAAHWLYKDPNHAGAEEGSENHISRNMPSRTEFILPKDFDLYKTTRNLESLFGQDNDPDEALHYAKMELFQDQVFCFTPKGRVIDLPKGATALDFAYALHTDIGDTCIGVEINNLNRPLRTALKNGDVIKILRSENTRPPEDWESLATTGRARSAIRRHLKQLEREEQIERGRSVAENLFSVAKFDFSLKAVKTGLSRLNLRSPNEVLARIGRGDMSANELLEAIYPGADKITDREVRAANSGARVDARYVVSGITPGYSSQMSPCCLPLPGERIVGIRSGADLIHVHTIFCNRLASDDPSQDLWVDLKWRSERGNYRAKSCVEITASNEVGSLSEIASVMARYNVSIINIRFVKRTPAFFDLLIDVVLDDIQTLTQMLTALRAIKSTISASRHEANTIEDDDVNTR